MKKFNKKYLPLLLLTFLATGCGKKLSPEPTNKNDTPIDGGLKDAFTYGDLYDDLFANSGNTMAFNWVTSVMAKELNIPTKRADDIQERIDETQKAWLKNSSYYFNDIFKEEKIVNSLTSIGYNITCNNGYFTASDRDNNPWSQDDAKRLSLYVLDSFGEETDEKILKCDYTDYINKSLIPTIYQSMIEEEYIVSQRLEELAKAKKVRKIETFSITKDSSDLDLTLFVESVSRSLQGEAVDFTKFIHTAPITGHELYDFSTYENIWKNYRKSLIDKEIRKIGTLGGLSEETDESKKATDEEKRTIINKYTGNNAYSIERGKWLSYLEIDKVEYVKEDVYSSDNAPFTGSLKAILFNKNSGDGIPGDVLHGKIHEETYTNAKGTEVTDRFIIDANSYGEDKDIILYQTQNDNNKYTFIKLIYAYVNQTSDVDGRNYECAKAYAPSLSINKKAYVHYFEELDLQFGSQSVYDYFLANYPDYFDDKE